MFSKSDDWLSYIQQIHPQEMDMGLARITRVADHLNVRKFSIPVITVAGTNGKGSTVAMLSAIYLANGYRVASYTSPHILQFHERIQINGQSINDELLIAAFNYVEQGRKQIGVTLTYFEFAVLTALTIFHQQPFDVVILEVGLGGRLDATNIVDATCAVITNIDFDHEAILGYTREAIGAEKAGIIRENIPVIFGDDRPVTAIINKAAELQAQLFSIDQEFNYQKTSRSTWTFSNQENEYANLPVPKLPLMNACIALQTVEVLKKVLPFQANTLATIFQNVNLAGRWQSIKNPICEIRVDVAHNPQSVSYLAALCQDYPVQGKTIAICSMLIDKNQKAMLQACHEVFSAWHIAALDVARGTPLEDLHKQFQALAIEPVQPFPSIEAALLAAIAIATPYDRIICFGSFYTVAESLKTLQNQGYNL